MSFILVTNDDGVDSPALLPLVRALGELAPVRVVVPDGERSWIGKAITRRGEVQVRRIEREGVAIHVTTGFPADCTQLGAHSLFEDRPEMVVSGINVGFNHTLAYLLSSGTVGGAAEGWIAGLPALAFSCGDVTNHRKWAEHAWSDDSRADWERAAALACDIVRDVREHGFPDGVDLLSVNFPHTAGPETPRRLTRLARVGYEELFKPRGDGAWAHDYRGGFRPGVALEGTDLEAAEHGHVSITPVRLAHEADLDAPALRAIERKPRQAEENA